MKESISSKLPLIVTKEKISSEMAKEESGTNRNSLCDESNAIVAVTEIKLPSYLWALGGIHSTPNLALWLLPCPSVVLQCGQAPACHKVQSTGQKSRNTSLDPESSEMFFKSLILKVQFGFNSSIHLEETSLKDGQCPQLMGPVTLSSDV